METGAFVMEINDFSKEIKTEIDTEDNLKDYYEKFSDGDTLNNDISDDPIGYYGL